MVLLVDAPLQGPSALVNEVNTTVLFRPVHPPSLVTVVRALLRARERQYQVRDLLAEQDRVNQELVEHLMGRKASNLIGMAVWDIFPGARDSPLARRYREAEASREPVTFETHLPSLGAWLQVRAYPGTEGLTLYLEDITERKRSEEELTRNVQEVMTDTAWFSRSLMEKIAQFRKGKRGDDANEAVVAELTTRERQVLERMASGRDNGSIATELGIKEQTVRNYITRIYEKLDLHSRADAIVWARERGLVAY